jgi:hypothetical protein
MCCVEIAAAIGFDMDAVRAFLELDAGEREVVAEELQAQLDGVHSVPMNSCPSNVTKALGEWQATQLQEGHGMTEWGMSIGDRIMGIRRSTASLEPA